MKRVSNDNGTSKPGSWAAIGTSGFDTPAQAKTMSGIKPGTNQPLIPGGPGAGTSPQPPTKVAVKTRK
jgi:hypothetical protein